MQQSWTPPARIQSSHIRLLHWSIARGRNNHCHGTWTTIAMGRDLLSADVPRDEFSTDWALPFVQFARSQILSFLVSNSTCVLLAWIRSFVMDLRICGPVNTTPGFRRCRWTRCHANYNNSIYVVCQHSRMTEDPRWRYVSNPIV